MDADMFACMLVLEVRTSLITRRRSLELIGPLLYLTLGSATYSDATPRVPKSYIEVVTIPGPNHCITF
jgi:hypothetical protein